MKLSKFFNSAKHLPVRKGFYQCGCCDGMYWWNGKFFQIKKTGKYAKLSTWLPEWRGIIK